MDQNNPGVDSLDVARRKAGADYLSAIRSLGLRPDALFWAFDHVEDRFILMLATEMFDFKGPLAVSQLLFKAYNAAATPREVDPFVVRLHSPDHELIRAFDGWKDPEKTKITAQNGKVLDHPIEITGVKLGEVQFFQDWVYTFTLPPRRKPVDLLRRWRRLEENVERLAA